MSVYNATPLPPFPGLLLPGQAGYCFGSFDDHIPTTKLLVNATSESAGNAITLHVQVWEGPNPAASQLLTTQGLTNVPNVTNAVIGSVSLNTSGVGTIVVPDASAHGVQTLLADFGLALVPQVEVAEVLAPVGQATSVTSIAFAVPNYGARQNEGRGVTAIVKFVSLPTTATVKLQGAIKNQDSEFADIGTVATVATGAQVGGSLNVQDINFEFYRLNVTSISGGTLPSLIAKLLV
jgi:hypothetical protein